MEIPEEIKELMTPINIEGICDKEPNLVKRYMLRQQLEAQEEERKRKLEEWRKKQVSFK